MTSQAVYARKDITQRSRLSNNNDPSFLELYWSALFNEIKETSEQKQCCLNSDSRVSAAEAWRGPENPPRARLHAASHLVHMCELKYWFVQ